MFTLIVHPAGHIIKAAAFSQVACEIITVEKLSPYQNWIFFPKICPFGN